MLVWPRCDAWYGPLSRVRWRHRSYQATHPVAVANVHALDRERMRGPPGLTWHSVPFRSTRQGLVERHGCLVFPVGQQGRLVQQERHPQAASASP